jgi:hypothetical protein
MGKERNRIEKKTALENGNLAIQISLILRAITKSLTIIKGS